jgi:pimeloyl-ACP methyl ester carboxylesterase
VSGSSALFAREYGAGSRSVVVLHGGPAAAGDVAPLARALGARWHVLEPFQRGSGAGALSVATHVADLDDLVATRCHPRPAIVGHSWGAMLALSYTAAHPAAPAALALIGSGTFSEASRETFVARLESRLTSADRGELARLAGERNDNRRLAATGRLMTRVYGYDINAEPDAPGELDAAAHDETWSDMVRLLRAGTFPAAFAAVTCPVLMLHGEDDPHPGPLIRDELRRYIPHLEYQPLERCGHSPWLERHASDAFYSRLHAWLARWLV